MWIKLVAENIVAIGITEKFSELTALIYNVFLPYEGDVIEKIQIQKVGLPTLLLATHEIVGDAYAFTPAGTTSR